MAHRGQPAGRLPAAWALRCGLHDCPGFLEDVLGFFQSVLGLLWLEALLAASSDWLRGRPLLAFALGSAALYSVLMSPTSATFLHKALAYGSRWPLEYLVGLFLPPTVLSIAWGFGAAVTSGLIGMERERREQGYVITALAALAAGLFIFLITPL